MPISRSVSILGREGNIEPGEFGLEFFFGGLGDEGQLTKVAATLLKLTIAKAFGVIDEGSPANRNCNLSRHKV